MSLSRPVVRWKESAGEVVDVRRGDRSAEAASLAEAHVIEHDEHNIRRTVSATETVQIGVDLGAPPSPPPIASTRTCDLLSQPYAQRLFESLQSVRCLPVRYLYDRPI